MSVYRDLRYDPTAHAYFIDGQRVPSVTQILQDVGLIDTTYFTDEARERGSFAHKAIQLWLADNLDESDLSEGLKGYLDSARQFMAMVGTVHEVEMPRFHPAMRFAGTPDLVCTIDEYGFAVPDFKIGAKEASHRYQSAAYAFLVALGDRGDNEILSFTPMKPGRIMVHLDADGKPPKLEPYPAGGNDERIFLAALTVYHAKHQHGVATALSYL